MSICMLMLHKPMLNNWRRKKKKWKHLKNLQKMLRSHLATRVKHRLILKIPHNQNLMNKNQRPNRNNNKLNHYPSNLIKIKKRHKKWNGNKIRNRSNKIKNCHKPHKKRASQRLMVRMKTRKMGTSCLLKQLRKRKRRLKLLPMMIRCSSLMMGNKTKMNLYKKSQNQKVPQSLILRISMINSM